MAYTANPLLADTSSTIREDLTNYITNLSPTDTPLFSMLGTESVSNITFEWLMDNVPFTAEIQSAGEGAEATFDMKDNAVNYRRTRAANQTMITRKTVDVTGTQRAVNEAGVEDEYSFQVIRQGLSLMKQAEYNLHWSTYVDGVTAAYNRGTHGLAAWLLSTGITSNDTGESSVTIAGKAIPYNYGATVLYRAARMWVEATGSTDGFTQAIALTYKAPPYLGWDASVGRISRLDVGATLPRVRISDPTTIATPWAAGTYTGMTIRSYPTSYPTAFWETPTMDAGTGTAYTAPVAGPPYVPGAEAFAYFGSDLTRTELFDLMLSPAWGKGMNIQGAVALCGVRVKRIISNFATVYSGSGATQTAAMLNDRNIGVDAKLLSDTIDVYESDLGKIYVNLDRYMNGSEHLIANGGSARTNTSLIGWHDTDWSKNRSFYIQPNASLFIIEPEFFKIGLLRGLTHEPLAKTGDSNEGMLLMEYGLKCLNPIAGIAGFGVANT